MIPLLFLTPDAAAALFHAGAGHSHAATTDGVADHGCAIAIAHAYATAKATAISVPNAAAYSC